MNTPNEDDELDIGRRLMQLARELAQTPGAPSNEQRKELRELFAESVGVPVEALENHFANQEEPEAEPLPEPKTPLEKLLREYSRLPEFSNAELTSVNQRGGFDNRPIHTACWRRRLKEVQLLIEAGADVNAPGEFEDRAINVAVQLGQVAIAEALLRAGARCDLPGMNGDTAWDEAHTNDILPQLKALDKAQGSSALESAEPGIDTPTLRELVGRIDPSQLPPEKDGDEGSRTKP